MKKSEIYGMAIEAIITGSYLSIENKVRVLDVLYDDRRNAEFAEDLAEKYMEGGADA